MFQFGYYDKSTEVFLFFWSGLIPYNAKQPLRVMELQEKKAQKD